jgi:hypothetical protein
MKKHCSVQTTYEFLIEIKTQGMSPRRMPNSQDLVWQSFRLRANHWTSRSFGSKKFAVRKPFSEIVRAVQFEAEMRRLQAEPRSSDRPSP